MSVEESNEKRLERMLALLDDVMDLVYDCNYGDHVKDSLVARIIDGVELTESRIKRVKDEK